MVAMVSLSKPSVIETAIGLAVIMRPGTSGQDCIETRRHDMQATAAARHNSLSAPCTLDQVGGEGDWACSGQKRRREDRVVAGRGVADDADAGDGDGRSSLVGHFPVKKASNMQAFLKTLKAPTWEKRAESGAEQGAERGEAGGRKERCSGQGRREGVRSVGGRVRGYGAESLAESKRRTRASAVSQPGFRG